MIRALRWLRQHVGLVLEVAGYGFWLLVDLLLSYIGATSFSVLAALAAAAAALLRWHRSVRQDMAAAVAVAVSLTISGIGRAGLPLNGQAGADLGMFSFTEQLALAILVIAVLRGCPLRRALLLAAVAAVAIVGSPLARMEEAPAVSFAVLSALGWGGAMAIGLALREVDTRRRAALEDVRTSERMELARELHDVVAHHVTGIVVAAQAAAVVARRNPEEVDRALAAIETAGTDALAAMRSMVGVLRGGDANTGARTPGAELGQVRTLIERFDPEARLVKLSTDPGLEHAVLPAGVAATGYRVVQEALTNVRRHAPEATAVEVDIRVHGQQLWLAVRSDGLRPATTPRGGTGGFGLAGMAERVAALDGALSAGPTAPGVWTVAARLPLTATSKGTG